MGGMVTDWTEEGAYGQTQSYPGLSSCSYVVGAIGTGNEVIRSWIVDS